MILECRDVTKTFGGVRAVDSVTFNIEPGELSSIIGPNGAGKTTLFHVITGYHRCDGGQVFFGGNDITNKSPVEIQRMGLARSFQAIGIFPRLSVFRNVQIAFLSHKGKTMDFLSASQHLAEGPVEELLRSVELDEQWHSISGSLSRGDQKRLEIAIALASEPKLLLLDEPTAGMSPVERLATIDLIKRLTKKEGLTTVFCEHDIDMVFNISEKIRVMHFGKLIAEGMSDEIRGNELVRNVYLGETQ